MKTAKIFAQNSTAVKLKVGAIVVKNDTIISIGYNGTPHGWDNTCEDAIGIDGRLVTRPEVIHAEDNAIAKLAKNGGGGDGAIMYVTHSPCIECAKIIYGAGIKKVFYEKEYKSLDGVEFLRKCEVSVDRLFSGL
jgi:dCMP deaminase